MISHGSIRNVLINKEKFSATSRGASIECDKIRVAYASEDFYFIHVLVNTLEIALVQALNCDYTTIIEYT